LNTQNDMRRESEEASPWPGWPALFFGCFYSGGGSKKWSKRSAYGVFILLAGFAGRFGLKGHVPEVLLDYGIAVTVGAAVGIMYWAMWRYMQDLDEMHQRIMLEAIAFSFFTTMTLVAFAGIADLARNTAVNVLLVYVTAEILRGIGLVLAARRYR
jgi:hypothetical protein